MKTLRGAWTHFPRSLAVILPLSLAGCNITDSRTPDEKRFFNLAVVSGAEQVGLPGSQVDPVTIRLISTVKNEPIAGWQVHFRAPVNSGIVFNPATAITDADGRATTQVTLGTTLGRYAAEVDFSENPGAPTPLTLEAALVPSIADVSHATVGADQVLVINGENFSNQSLLNEVRIDGARATVISASSIRLEVPVPPCFPTRAAKVSVSRGALVSAPADVSVTAASGNVLGNLIKVGVGQAVTVSNRADLPCVRIGAQANDAA